MLKYFLFSEINNVEIYCLFIYMLVKLVVEEDFIKF